MLSRLYVLAEAFNCTNKTMKYYLQCSNALDGNGPKFGPFEKIKICYNQVWVTFKIDASDDLMMDDWTELLYYDEKKTSWIHGDYFADNNPYPPNFLCTEFTIEAK